MSEKTVQGIVQSKAVTQTEDGEVIIPVVGIPFGSPDRRDLHGDYFDSKTKTGNLKEVYSYLDHGYDWYIREGVRGYIEDHGDELSDGEKWRLMEDAKNAFGDNLIGTAKKVETTAEGVIYNIIVDKNHRYKDLLRRLAEQGYLGASSKCNVRIDDEKIRGRIDEWHTIEVSLTPTPASPDAQAILKSFISEAVMTKKGDEIQPVPPGDSQNGSENPAGNVAPGSTEEKKSLKERIEEKFNGAADEQQQPEQEQPVSVADLLKSIMAEIAAIKAELAEVKKSIAANQADLETAVETLGEQIAKSLHATVQSEVSKSAPERIAQTNVRQTVASQNGAKNNHIPAGAPGKS